MKKNYTILFTLLLFFISAMEIWAQAPKIHTLSKKYLSSDEILFLTGTNFSNDKTELKVFFGPVAGEIVASSTDVIEVMVPSGTTFGTVSVTNLVTGLTAYSSDLFDLSFHGQPFNVALMAGQTDFPSENGLYDLCQCDFDGDGKTDIVTSTTSSGVASIYRNISTPGTVNFAKTTLNFNVPLYSVSCRDLDGDGKPDLMAARTGSNSVQIFIAKNTSTVGSISFGAPSSLDILGNNPAKILARDLDGDGKPEIVVTNRFNNQLSVFKNNSTPGTINLNNTPVSLVLSETANTQGLSIEDLNGDGLPEIVASTSNGSNLFYLHNKSTEGSFSFSSPVKISLEGVLINVAVGDLDQDGYPEIAVTNIINHNISVYKNNTSEKGGLIQFASAVNYPTVNNPWGITLGDLDGDGKTDIAVASTDVAEITFLRNESTVGTLALVRNNLAVIEKSRNILMGDIDGDGKPDLSFTSSVTNKLSVKRNGNCLSNSISPSGPLTLCQGADLVLNARVAGGANYTWKRNNVNYKDGPEPFLDIIEGGDYTVTITEAGGSCESTSSAVTVNTAAETIPATPVASNNGPVCEGSTLVLSSNSITGATYKWTGPNNFSSDLQNPEIPNVSSSMAGLYFLVVQVGSCHSESSSTSVEVYRNDPQYIEANGPTSFCEGGDVILSIPTMTGFEYQWKKDGTDIPDATSSVYQANMTGSYSVALTEDGCTSETAPVSVELLAPPLPSFTAPEMVCLDKPFSITNTSEIASGAAVHYLWSFGDGTTATTKDVTHQYSAVGQYLIKLAISYGENECLEEFTRNISVESSLNLLIQPDVQDRPCEGDIVTLSVAGEYASYLWSTGSTDATLKISESGTYSLSVTTAEGCTGAGEITIDYLSAPIIDVIAENTHIGTGETVQFEASGAFTYSWLPVDGLSDPFISNPIAAPIATTTYIVTGTAANGCTTQKEVTVEVTNTVNVIPKKIFSPNGDQIEDQWIIERIENYQSCKLEVFDRQGVKIFSAKPYQNSWDGTINGKPVMEGVYFYVLKCDEGRKAGSVTLIR